MDRLRVARGPYAEEANEGIARAVHQGQHQAKGPAEEQERPRADERHPPGVLERHSLRSELAADDVQKGDERERDRHRDRVQGDGRRDPDRPEQGLDQMGDGRLADPAERDAGDGDAELRSRDGVVHVVDGMGREGGAAPALLHPQVDLGAPHGDQGKLGGDEEGVGEDEQGNGEETEERDT